MSSKGNSLKIKRPSLDISDDKNIIEENYEGKFFIMSLEFSKTFQIEAMIALITKKLVKAKNVLLN